MDIHTDIQHQWDIEKWQGKVAEVNKATNEFKEQCLDLIREINEDGKKKKEEEALRSAVMTVRDLESAVSDIEELLSSRYIKAEQESIAFIKGEAGSGKSHLLAKMAENALSDNQPAVLLLGQLFNDSEIWHQIGNNLDLPNYSGEEILGTLDAACKSAGVRSLLLIDAINEGVGSKFWRDRLASFIEKLSHFSHICCVISCRSEYFDLAIPKELSNKYEPFVIRGFETPEEQLQASRIYMDNQGISRPSTPWLAPEFVNPLFLRSVCLSLERDGKSEIPSGLNGAKENIGLLPRICCKWHYGERRTNLIMQNQYHSCNKGYCTEYAQGEERFFGIELLP